MYERIYHFVVAHSSPESHFENFGLENKRFPTVGNIRRQQQIWVLINKTFI